MFVSIKKILPLAVKRMGFKGEADLNEIKLVWAGVARELFGQQMGDKIILSKFKNKILFISCPNSVWANELQAGQNELIIKLNEELKNNRIEKIRFLY